MSYSISVDPEVAANFTGRNSAQLMLSYDIKYNISVIASLCKIITANHFIIHHGKLIDNIDYVTGIGNSSREQYSRVVTRWGNPCRIENAYRPTKNATADGHQPQEFPDICK